MRARRGVGGTAGRYVRAAGLVHAFAKAAGPAVGEATVSACMGLGLRDCLGCPLGRHGEKGVSRHVSRRTACSRPQAACCGNDSAALPLPRVLLPGGMAPLISANYIFQGCSA